jgi:hypothetical protein
LKLFYGDDVAGKGIDVSLVISVLEFDKRCPLVKNTAFATGRVAASVCMGQPETWRPST